MPKKNKRKHAHRGRPPSRKQRLVRPGGVPPHPESHLVAYRRWVVREHLRLAPNATLGELLDAARAPASARTAFSRLRECHSPLASVAALAARLRRCHRVVVLLGAGASVAAGVPCFRAIDPAGREIIDEPLRRAFSGEDPAGLWRLLPVLRRAHPTGVHQLLAALADSQRLLLVATQNVDDLERCALAPGLVAAVHGSARTFRCSVCAARAPPPEVACTRPPTCADCGHPVRPDIVFYNEPIVAEAFDRACAAIAAADLILVVGTSLCVSPFSRLWKLGEHATRFSVNTVRQAYSREGEGEYVGDCQLFSQELLRALQ